MRYARRSQGRLWSEAGRALQGNTTKYCTVQHQRWLVQPLSVLCKCWEDLPLNNNMTFVCALQWSSCTELSVRCFNASSQSQLHCSILKQSTGLCSGNTSAHAVTGPTGAAAGYYYNTTSHSTSTGCSCWALIEIHHHCSSDARSPEARRGSQHLLRCILWVLLLHTAPRCSSHTHQPPGTFADW